MFDYLLYVTEICKKLDFPANATTCFIGVEKRLLRNETLAQAIEEQVDRFSDTDTYSLGNCLDVITDLAKANGENVFTLHFIYLLHCLPKAHAKYMARGISEDLWIQGLYDLKWKLLECMTCKNVPGTFVAGWYEGMLRVGRFTLGRFQYEPFGTWGHDDVTLPCGYTVTRDHKVLHMHIPSSGVSLTDEVRNASYAMAADYFKDYFEGGPVIITTHSWLIYPPHKEFLPADSKILKFMDDFFVTEQEDRGGFPDDWRVFGAYADLPVDEWPEDTSLRRAYKQRLLDGKCGGSGRGLIVMDNGVNVTKKVGYFKG